MLLLFSHKLTDEQLKDANDSLGVEEFISLPKELMQIWSNIPPDRKSIRGTLQPIFEFMRKNLKKNDYVLIQGDFGAVFIMVESAFSLELIPVYATTERRMVEAQISENEVRTERIFKHKQFRKYEKGVLLEWGRN